MGSRAGQWKVPQAATVLLPWGVGARANAAPPPRGWRRAAPSPLGRGRNRPPWPEPCGLRGAEAPSPMGRGFGGGATGAARAKPRLRLDPAAAMG
jgi:hypothetical protein